MFKENEEEQLPVIQKKSSGGFTPVSHETLQEFLNTCGYPKSVKAQVVKLVQTNNRKKVDGYLLDFVPDGPARVENGRIVK
jgi:hypothetical protein